MEKGYREHGQEVIIVKKVEEGYLVRGLLDSGEGEIEGEIEFREKIYSSPPTEKLADDILRLNMEIAELRKKKSEEQASLNKANTIPNFQMIVDYFSGDFKWLLTQNKTIQQASSVFNSHNVCIELVKGELRLYTLNNNYFGSDKRWITVFKTKEAAEEECRKRVIASINEIPNEWRLNDMEREYPDLMKDSEIRLLYENKKVELAETSKMAAIKFAKREIAKYTKVLKGYLEFSGRRICETTKDENTKDKTIGE